MTVAGCLTFIPISCMGPKLAPKDKDLIFNQFICTGVCACSSNLNYAHKCIENSLNAWKCPNEPWIIPTLLWSLQIKGLAIQTPSMAAVTPLCNSNQDQKSSRSHTVYSNQPCEMQHKISSDRVWWHFARQFFGWSDSKFLASAEISTSPPPPPYQKPHFSPFRLPFQVETFTPCLQCRRLLAGDPPSR